MIVLPFIYFTILLFILYSRNKRFDMACYIVSFYAGSAFFSILIDVFGLRSFDTSNYQISFLATFVYCGLITLCVWPISHFSNAKIYKIQPLRNAQWLKVIAWISFINFIIMTILSMNRINEVLTGDIWELRKEIYLGIKESSMISEINPVIRFPFVLINMILGCPWILQLLAFFSLSIQKLPKKYPLMFLLASCLVIISSIVGVDRSGVTFWIMGLGACYIIFKPFFTSKQKRIVNFFGLILICLMVVYLALITKGRFGEDDAESSIISYLGQSYINFCYFFDTYKCPFPTLSMFFPFTSKLILGNAYMEGVEMQHYLTLLSGKHIAVFATYIGQIIKRSNNFIAILYCVIFVILSFSLLKIKKQRVIELKDIFLYYLFSSVMFYGSLYYYYGTFTKTFSVVFFYILILIMNFRSVRTQ